jgi:hypothetical protein
MVRSAIAASSPGRQMQHPWNNRPQQIFKGTPTHKGSITMDNAVIIQPLVALIAGILILIMPRLLNYVVALYLILVGVLGLWPQLMQA